MIQIVSLRSTAMPATWPTSHWLGSAFGHSGSTLNSGASRFRARAVLESLRLGGDSHQVEERHERRSQVPLPSLVHVRLLLSLGMCGLVPGTDVATLRGSNHRTRRSPRQGQRRMTSAAYRALGTGATIAKAPHVASQRPRSEVRPHGAVAYPFMPRSAERWLAASQTFCLRSPLLQAPRDAFATRGSTAVGSCVSVSRATRAITRSDALIGSPLRATARSWSEESGQTPERRVRSISYIRYEIRNRHCPCNR